MIFRTWRFATTLSLALSVGLLAPLAGCSSDEDPDSDSAQTEGEGEEKEDPGSDIVVADVALPEFVSVEANVMDEQYTLEESYPDGAIWKRTTVRTFTDFDPAHPERGGWEFNGPFEEYYPDLTPKCSGMFADGKMTGQWTWYFEDGTKSKEATYEAGVVSGTVTFYRPETGFVQRVESYNHGEKHGEWRTYAEDGETLLSRATFRDGAPDGVVTDWYPSGNKKQETHFVDGKLHGTRTTWYDTDPGEPQQIALIENYTDGKPNGQFAQYGPNGARLLDIQYKDGERVQESSS